MKRMQWFFNGVMWGTAFLSGFDDQKLGYVLIVVAAAVTAFMIMAEKHSSEIQRETESTVNQK